MTTSDQATVTLTLGGEPFTLRPTFDVMRVLGRLQGGFLPLFRAVSNVDGETMALIVAAGTSARGARVEEVTRAVYDHGLEDLVNPLTRFLVLCTHGGRDLQVRQSAPADEKADDGAALDVPKAEADRGLRVDVAQDAEKRTETESGATGSVS